MFYESNAERKLLYIYLAQQYLANDKVRDNIVKNLYDYNKEMIELFGEVIEDAPFPDMSTIA